MTTRSIALLFAVVAVPVAASAGEVRAPAGDGLPPWEEVAVAPDWLDAPKVRDGHVPVVGSAQSNLRHLAYSAASHPEVPAFRDLALADCRTECARRLRGPLGKDADAVVARGVAGVTLARRASRSVTTSDALGGTTVTVWALWEVPLEPLLGEVPADRRDAAKAALLATTGAAAPWHEGPTPDWVAKPAAREGHAVVLVAERAPSVAAAKADLTGLGADRMVERLIAALEPVVGSRGAAFEPARAASSWWSLRARTVRVEGREAIAWAAYDVPLDPIVERLPEDRRAAARRALEGHHRAD